MGGQDVRVWVDRWLPSLPLGRSSPIGEVVVTRNLRVDTLICPQSRDWNINFLLPFLSVVDQEAIEGYRWLQSRSLSVRDHLLPYVRSIPDELWKRIWKTMAFTCWYIWKAQCNYVFNQVRINPLNVVLAISNAVGFFLAASSNYAVNGGRENVGQTPSRAPYWIPPPPPFTRINVDASWFKMSSSGFVGVVLRDAEARFIAVAWYHIRAPCAAAAEALALLRGCELGASLGYSEVILESDSSKAVSCLLNSLENGSWEAFLTLERVKTLGEAFQNCHWSWVPRSANMVADTLTS
ncbi:uncharacterized protein LOC125470898 [Pyrus x bretschneideri]|uniref:uncharacterized protein LOC125470898 n=1 Tax=Pyrus x bretschneideri TaxID=225117 RepID=UPI00202FF735|nr:uncharacterized protein LOC125470898 [Pyrus x bretschneideri]